LNATTQRLELLTKNAKVALRFWSRKTGILLPTDTGDAIVTEAVTKTIDTATDEEAAAACRRTVWTLIRRELKLTRPERPDTDASDNDPDDWTPLDGDIRAKSSVGSPSPDWQLATEMENRVVARIDATRALQRVLTRDEVQFYTSYHGSRVGGQRQSEADRAHMARIRKKLQQADLI